MIQDLRYALRLMRKSPGFTGVAVLTLAVGIGATTAIFSIVNAALLRPLPYRDPSRLIMVTDRNVRQGGLAVFFPRYRDFEEYQRRATAFEFLETATWATGPTTMTGRGAALGVMAFPVSLSFFDMLSVKAAMGRTFLPDDKNHGCSVVLAHPFWAGKLGGDAKIVGQSLALNGQSCTALGVMPQRFAFYPPATEIWRLVDTPPFIAGIFGRLKQGVTRRQAQAELESIYRGLHASDDWKDLAPTVNDMQLQFTFLAGRNLRTTLLILLGAVVLVLLIACVNVANLLMGRALVRGDELAIRAALGGRPARLFQQLITEGVVLGSFGGGLGILAAFGALRYFRGTSPVELPVGADISLDLPLLAFALLISLATAVLFGMAPAWRGSLAALGARGMVGGRLRLVKLLVAGEMALSVILLAGAGLLMESVLRMGSAPMGFDPDHLYFTDIPVPKNPRFYDVVEGRVSGIPGLQSAALTSPLPTNGGGFDVLDVMGTTGTGVHDVGHKMVSPSYFETLRVALLAGRSFNAHDREGSEPVAVINDTLAREYFLGRDPLGQRVRVSKDAPYATIVGVVASEKQTTVTEEMNYVASPTLYRPLAQDPVARLSIAIRTASDAVPIGAAIRREMAALDPNLAVRDLESMRHKLATFMAYPRFRAVLLSAFAAFALLLAAVGLHGVLGQLVAQRTPEIGVRMALGASPADVAGLIVRQAGAPVVAGLGIGLGLAMFLDRYFSRVLYSVRPRDPATLAGASLVLLAVAAVATALPAYRAAKTDPVEALR